MKSIDQLLTEIDENRLDCSADVDKWVDEELASLRGDIIRFERDGAYQRYVRRFIANDYDPSEHGGKPRCDCGNDCPVLEGRLPALVKEADDPGRAQEEWAIRHPGTPYALLAADDEYREDLAALITGLHRIERVTRRDRIPESEQADAETGEEDLDGAEREVTA